MLNAQNTNLQELESIDRMNEHELDTLPFGAIRLDRTGKILSYNATEARLTGRDPKRVIGRNFFTDVARRSDAVTPNLVQSAR